MVEVQPIQFRFKASTKPQRRSKPPHVNATHLGVTFELITYHRHFPIAYFISNQQEEPIWRAKMHFIDTGSDRVPRMRHSKNWTKLQFLSVNDVPSALGIIYNYALEYQHDRLCWIYCYGCDAIRSIYSYVCTQPAGDMKYRLWTIK